MVYIIFPSMPSHLVWRMIREKILFWMHLKDRPPTIMRALIYDEYIMNLELMMWKMVFRATEEIPKEKF